MHPVDPARAEDDRGDLGILAQAYWLLTGTLDLDEVLARLARMTQVRLAVDVVRIWLRAGSTDDLVLGAQIGTLRAGQSRRLPIRQGLAGWVIERREPVVLADVLTDPRLRSREWFEAEGIASFLGVPIVLDETAIGVLACLCRTRREFSPVDVRTAEALSLPAAVAVRNAQLYTDALSRVEEIEAFQRVTADTLSSPDLGTVLGSVVRETRHLLRADAAHCALTDPATLEIREILSDGARSEEFPRCRMVPGEGLVGLALRERRPLRSDDYLADGRFVRRAEFDAWARGEGVVSLIGAPVFDRAGALIALLWAYNRQPAAFTARHEATLAGLAQQAALAIAKARSFEEERRRAGENAALLEIARTATSSVRLRPLLARIAQQTAAAVGAERCAIHLRSDGRLAPVMWQYADGRRDGELARRLEAWGARGIEQMPAYAEALRTRRPVVVKDAGAGERLAAEWVEAFGVGSVLIVPLVSKGQVIGTLDLDSAQGGRAWDEAQVALAASIAAQVGLGVDMARQYSEAQRRAAEVETLGAIGETLTSTLDLQAVLETIADSAIDVTGAQRVIVFEADAAGETLCGRAVRGQGFERGFALRMGQGAAGAAAVERRPVASADVLVDPVPGQGTLHAQSGTVLDAMIRQHGFRAILAVPILSRDTLLGAVAVYWDAPHHATEREVRLLGTLARYAAIGMDNARLVGELKKTLEELKTTQETLVRGATLRAVGELSAGAAHHLNNLMAVVLGRSQLLLKLNAPDGFVASLKMIEKAAQDAASTVRRIQTFARTEKAAATEAVDVNAVIREGIELTRPRWEHEAQLAGARIDLAFEAGALPRVAGARSEIREAIANLILNATDAMPEGGRLEIRSWAEGPRVSISVRDTGAGMSEEVTRRAFEPFFTTKGVKRTGLGLATVYGTIRRHGGEISLESAPAQGTLVRFWLPASQSAEPAAPPAHRPQRGPGSVLVIDDDSEVRDLVSEVLASRGFTVGVATGGREGLACFQRDRYDLVLTDVGMPDMTGWDVARTIKRSSPDVPVLLLTGWADTLQTPEGVRVDGVVGKPFDLDQLTAAITDALAASQDGPA